MKFMTIVHARENQGMPLQGMIDAIGKLGMEAGAAGVFVQMGGLLPASTGGRIRQSGGKLTITDGPYAEAKEVVGGFAIYELPSLKEAMEWARRFMQLHVDHWPTWEGE